MVKPYLILLLVVAAERLVELAISRRNARWALQHGGREFGRGHFQVMKVLHTCLLIGCAAEVAVLGRPFHPRLAACMLALLAAAQGLRYWAIWSLGPYWNVRVIVVPGHSVLTRGPYRFMRHPNYLAVVIEGVALPMIHTAWLTALTFTLLNGALLAVRIRCEERALAEHCAYRERMGARGRFVPLPAAANLLPDRS